MKHPFETRRALADIRALGLPADAVDLEALGMWSEALAERASSTNLLGPEELARLWPRHLLESLAYALLLDRRLPVYDAGSGAGFPGVPLAMAGYEVTLVEPRRKRFLWLRYSVEVLGVPARVVRGRLEDVCEAAPEDCQFVCRALAAPAETLQMLAGYGRRGSLTLRRGPAFGDSCRLVRPLPSPPLDRDGVVGLFRLPEDLRGG